MTRFDDATTIFKPGYDGAKPSTVLSGPEKQTLRLHHADLVARLNSAMLCLSVSPGVDDLNVRSASQANLREFSDLVGREKDQVIAPRYKPTAAEIDAVDDTLALLEGLTKSHFKVVLLRAIDSFSDDWPWARIGSVFGMSDRWAETAYQTAVIQAARRAGILPPATTDFAILVCSVWRDAIQVQDRGWLSSITTTANPRQEASNTRSKSPVRIDGATAIWTSGQPVAKRVVLAARSKLAGRSSHASWFKATPESVIEELVAAARAIEAPWQIEEIDAARARAA